VTRRCAPRSSRSLPSTRPKAARHLLKAISSLLGSDNAAERSPPRKPWAWLLTHVFQADLQTCPRCAGPMRWVEAATTPRAIARLLAKPGLPPHPPPPRSDVPTGQLALPFSP